MTSEIVSKIRDRRRQNTARVNSKFKTQINDIRREIVRLSFANQIDSGRYQQLLHELKVLKSRLDQVAKFSN